MPTQRLQVHLKAALPCVKLALEPLHFRSVMTDLVGERRALFTPWLPAPLLTDLELRDRSVLNHGTFSLAHNFSFALGLGHVQEYAVASYLSTKC